MTWDEFKAEVDKQLEQQSRDGSIQIDYIDISSSTVVLDAWVDSETDTLCID